MAAASSSPPPESRALLLPIHSFGLANRLRLLSSGVTLSRLTNIPLYVDWRPSFGCNASLPDLIDFVPSSSPFDSFFRLFPSEKSDSLQSLLQSHEEARLSGARRPVAGGGGGVSDKTDLYDVSEGVQVLNVFGFSLDVRRFFTVPDSSTSDTDRAGAGGGSPPSSFSSSSSSTPPPPLPTSWIIVFASGPFIPKELPCATYYDQKSSLYKLLLSHLSPSLAPLVASFVAELFPPDSSSNNVVGVHYRAFDKDHDWAVVPPQSGVLVGSDGQVSVDPASSPSSSTAGTWGEVAPLSLFIADMQAMRAKDPTLKFFVASNSPEAKSILAQIFPPGVVYTVDFAPSSETSYDLLPPLTSSRSSLPGVQFAMLDFVLLSNTALVLHSFGSSFGEEAAALRSDNTYVSVRVGGDIYGIDVGLELCNNNQLLSGRRGEEGGSTKCFVDGRGKEVCMPLLAKKRCQAVEEKWGLPQVFC